MMPLLLFSVLGAALGGTMALFDLKTLECSKVATSGQISLS
jgi:hypothetical protein